MANVQGNQTNVAPGDDENLNVQSIDGDDTYLKYISLTETTCLQWINRAALLPVQSLRIP
jgi:hypothetical protein